MTYTYTSLDTVPLKLFFQALSTNDASLLSNNKDDLLRMPEVLKQLKADFEQLDPNNKIQKTFRTLKEIEEYRSQYNGIQFAIEALRFDRDLDLENQLREFGFKLTEDNFINNLDVIKNESQALLMFIEELEVLLPKHNDKKASNIDEVILGYSSYTNLQYTDTNSITVTQFYALKKVFDEKLKTAREQARKNKR
ncbi:hypothetical protein [uncultured Winogradskyella sp.]|uniref:hypothetical protein n=1 Tax=uncultured Winogradskyella sp. TaxID=395353 RepID=UPI0026168E8C|nr:hypothetical protein [uncultured Winogradskyella sp.]